MSTPLRTMEAKEEREEDSARLLAKYERLKALGTDKFKEKKWDEAIKLFNDAANLICPEGDKNPTRLGYYVICMSNIAQCCINLGDFKSAIKYTTEALSKDAKSVKAFYRRGLSHLALNLKEEALSDFKSCLVLDPGNKEVEEQAQKAKNMCLLDVAKSGDLKKMSSLLQSGANIQSRDKKTGCSPLRYASEHGHLEVVDLLLSKGADIRTRDGMGFSPLHYASKCGHRKVIELLISKGASVHDKDNHGYSPLITASFEGHFEVIELLLSNGASVHDKENNGFSPLITASQEGHLDVVELLLSKGASVHVKDNCASPLITASFVGHLKIVELLLSKGASVHVKEINGFSPLITASQEGHLDVVELLLSKGASVHDKENNGSSPLLIASQEGHLEVVELLLSKGASVHDKDIFGGTCLSRTRNNDIKYLLKNWGVTTVIIVLQELQFLSGLDPSSFLDLKKYIGVIE